MDTLGALALGTEPPTQELLHRKPYKRNASLLSWPMRRNIICQSAYQLTLLLVLLFKGAQWFNVEPISQINCLKYSNIDKNMGNNGPKWNILTSQQTSNNYYTDISCGTFKDLCPGLDRACFKEQHTIFAKNTIARHRMTLVPAETLWSGRQGLNFSPSFQALPAISIG